MGQNYSLGNFLLQSLPVPQISWGDVPHVVLENLKSIGTGRMSWLDFPPRFLTSIAN